MMPDTLATMTSAQRMREQAGFRDLPAYMSNLLAGMRVLITGGYGRGPRDAAWVCQP